MKIWAICKNRLLTNGPKWAVSKPQSHRHPRVLSIWVGEIFLCLISINSPTRFACRGIKRKVKSDGYSRFLRPRTARGSGTGLVTVGSTKV